jgi:hypothetical protein
MATRTRTAAALAAAGTLALMSWPVSAVADQTYRTQKYPVAAVEAAPEARGSVINVHANGPVIYGQERYHLAGAAPSTTYQVALEIFADEGCTVPTGLAFDTAALTTNGAGVGQAKATFYAQDVAPLIPQPTVVHARVDLQHRGRGRLHHRLPGDRPRRPAFTPARTDRPLTEPPAGSSARSVRSRALRRPAGLLPRAGALSASHRVFRAPTADQERTAESA